MALESDILSPCLRSEVEEVARRHKANSPRRERFTRKAESAGKWAVPVNARLTSQECPWCGAVKPKQLSEREHKCECNPSVVIDRDHAAGLVILARGVGVATSLGAEVNASACGAVPRVSMTVDAPQKS